MLVHKMVKNVKNSKVLEKIRTRDCKVKDTITVGNGLYDVYSSVTGEVFVIGLETEAQARQRIQSMESKNPEMKEHKLVVGKANSRSRDSKTHDEPTNNIKKLSEKLSSAGFQPRISGDGFSIDVFEKGKEVGIFYENKDNSFAVEGLSSRKLYDWIVSNGGSPISIADGLMRFPRISKDSKAKVKDMKVTHHH